MKKMVFLFCFLPLAILAQTTAGINIEHLPPASPGKIVPAAKKIRLSTGVELEYIEAGRPGAPVIIFLHGISDSYHSFASVFSYLPDSVHAIALSQRGHGNSSRPPGNYEAKDFARDVAAFIHQKQLGAVIIAGHSMGGVNAQQFAIDYPQLTNALVVIDSDPCFGKNPGMSQFQQDVNKMQSISWEFMLDFQKSTLAAPIDSSYFNLLVNEGMKVPVHVFRAALSGLMKTDFTEALKKLHKPALIFWGDQDAFCLRPGQEIFEKNLPDVEIKIYKGVGHALHWEAPENFVNDLLKFIQRINK